MELLEIRQLTLHDESAFLTGLKEWEGEDTAWFTFTWKEGMPFSEHIARLENDAMGIGLEEGRVPHTMLYGFLDGQIVGRCSIRHELNERLLTRGGNIGYAVAPRFRKRGFGSQLFKAGLSYINQLGREKVLLTCAPSNAASAAMIEGNGGVLENEVFVEEDGEILRRYWIDLKSSADY